MCDECNRRRADIDFVLLLLLVVMSFFFVLIKARLRAIPSPSLNDNLRGISHAGPDAPSPSPYP